MDCLAAWQPHCDSRNGKDSALPQKLARLGYTNELPGEVPAGRLREVLEGALVLRHPSAIENPFYRLFPQMTLVPMVVLATIATAYIARQAVITGASCGSLARPSN